MGIKCCKGCVAPKRHPGCHSKCEQFLKEKEEYEKEKEYIRNHPVAKISNYDFDRVVFDGFKKRNK